MRRLCTCDIQLELPLRYLINMEEMVSVFTQMIPLSVQKTKPKTKFLGPIFSYRNLIYWVEFLYFLSEILLC